MMIINYNKLNNDDNNDNSNKILNDKYHYYFTDPLLCVVCQQKPKKNYLCIDTYIDFIFKPRVLSCKM